MLHAIETCIEITVTIKSSPYPAEEDERIGNNETRNAGILDDPKKHRKAAIPSALDFGQVAHRNAPIPSTLDGGQVARQSMVAGGIVLGDAACRVVGIFPYHGGPKGFEKKNIEVIYVNETFSTERCCGIIGRANGFGLYDRFCTKKNCSVKAHHKSKFIPMTSLFFAPGANESAFCCHFADSLKKLRKQIRLTSQQWIESMDQLTPNVSFLVSTEHKLVSHPSNPQFYRLNSDCTDWKTMMHTIIKFLKEEKVHIDERDVKHTLIVTKDRLQTHELSRILVLCKLFFYHKNSKQLRELVTVCSYDDLSCKVCASSDRYNAIIVSDVSTLWAAIKEDVHQGFKSNSNLLCQLLKIGGIHQLAELFE